VTFVCPGATLGVMGGGQLGRMFVHAAQAMGYRVAVLDPDPESPAGQVSHQHICCEYLDEKGLALLAETAHAITTEFENVPAQALRSLAQRRPVAPDAEAVAICQDRVREKEQFLRCGVPCVPFAAIQAKADLSGVDESLLPGILKTSRLGYDGKGQVVVATRAELEAAWRELRGVSCVLEKKMALADELSVVVARNGAGHTVQLPAQRNLHRDGILTASTVGATDLSVALQARAGAAAGAIAQAMRYVGVLCVEFFVLADGSLVANEMAPRPHNSGHWSIDGSDVSQFELQVRTLAGLPLVAPRAHSAAVMLNLLGDLWFDSSGREREPDWPQVLAQPGAHLHLYGKRQARRGRKMGHLTCTAPDVSDARAAALRCAAVLGIAPF
jgi:5-(carboxyamino)imidazole ribonucleotide synthase